MCTIPDKTLSQIQTEGFYTSGTITCSDYNITSVKAYFVDANTGVTASKPTAQTVSLSAKSVDVRTKVDYVIYFAQLQTGTWKLVLEATNSNGDRATWQSNAFSITANPVQTASIVFNNVCTIPDMTQTYVKTNGFYTSGTITSTYPITKVEGYFVDAGTGALASKPNPQSVALNTAQVNIATQVDQILYFAQLQSGTWQLVLKATDSKGNTKTYNSNTFHITDTCDCSTSVAGWYRVASTGLNINSGHNWNSYIGEMPPDALCWVSKGSLTANYYHVSYEGLEGISSKNYLTKVASYTLTLNDNGGTGGAGSITVWDGVGDYSTVPVPYRSGYTFLGYYTSSSGGTKIYNANGTCTNDGSYWSGSRYVRKSGAVLYAQWQPNVIYVDSVTLNQETLSLTIGDTGTLTAAVLPANASNRNVNWFSSDTQVVIVIDGTVQAVGIGSATVMAESQDGTEKSAVCTVTVLPVYIRSIDFGTDTIVMTAGQNMELCATIQPSDATNTSLTWVSSDESVAYVDYGFVQAIAPGTTVIKAISEDGSGVFAQTMVTVTPAVYDFSLANDYSITMSSEGIGSRYPISYIIDPAEMAECIIWTSSNTDVAVVDANGVISAKGPGRAVISAEIPYGPSDSCIVNVRDDMSLLTLPSELELIEEGAFEGIAAERVVIKDACTGIGSKAFASNQLRYVLIPATVTSIAADAFDGGTQVCIVCSAGSEAQQYAQREGIRYIIDEEAAFVSVHEIRLQASASVEIEDTLVLSAVVSPANASNPKLTWSSSDESVAVVSSDGSVTGLNPGTAVITAAAMDGSGIMASCSVLVTLPDVTVSAVTQVDFQTDDGITAYLTAALTVTGADPGIVQQTGILFYNAAGQRIGLCMGEPALQEDSILCACDTGSDMSLVLMPQTTYTWRCVVVVKGMTFYSPYQSLTTPSLPPQIVLTETDMTLDAGSTATLFATVLYSDDTEVLWSTSNSSVAMVMEGEIVARSAGKATITARLVSDPTVSATCQVTVYAQAAEEQHYAMTLSPSTLDITRGDSARLEAVVAPPPDQAVQWTSDNPEIAMVDSNGTVTALSAGCANIYASVRALGLQECCRVTVFPKMVASVTLSSSSLTLYPGSSDCLTAEVLPISADERSIVWSSSDPQIVSVENGNLFAVAEGSAVITARAADGSGKNDICLVTVVPAPVNCGCDTGYAGYYVISRTNGTGLAISSGHGASTAVGNTELGLIPEGTEIYISMASGPAGKSGCWGHVTYNGISGYCAMYYVDPVLNVDTTNGHIVQSKLQAVIDRANAWADYTWIAPVDIPVYNNDFDDPADPVAYQQYFWYPAGTQMHGIPYTLSYSKYRLDTYPELSSAQKGTAANFTYEGWLMWGPKYGGDCSCLVNDVLWAGDPTLPHDGQVYMTQKSYLYSEPSWDELAPGDALVTSGHVMIVIAVDGNNVTIVESRGNGSTVGAIHCQHLTSREGGGWYVCGVCEYCNGAKKCGAIRRTVPKAQLQQLGYSVKRYKMLYVAD